MVLKAPSTPQNTVTQLRIAPDSFETPPWNISPNKETSINSEARRALDFEDATQKTSNSSTNDLDLESCSKNMERSLATYFHF
ncbi:hypothetical protein NC653_001856 [Populus alba x Populus x berolinensis]|uniref:Uncharacterized protein n=1 Tax=Populus alba x Populus x berolinensis TaxID=444605 RepID=A0AAD6WG46_9ROSI|nr:hypothetical protein NC653_001856 [Populus alba x Populus x berolinensis]